MFTAFESIYYNPMPKVRALGSLEGVYCVHTQACLQSGHFSG